MKNLFVITFLSVFTALNAIAQLRHVKGIESLGLEINKSNNGYGCELLYEKFLSNKVILKVGGYYEKRNIEYAKYTGYGLLPQLYNTVLNNKKNLFVDITGGINLGYEYANSKVSEDKVNSFVIGERIGLSIEYYIISSFKIEIQANQYFIQKSKFLKYGQIFSLGVAYNI
jgi:hypothetical protein